SELRSSREHPVTPDDRARPGTRHRNRPRVRQPAHDDHPRHGNEGHGGENEDAVHGAATNHPRRSSQAARRTARLRESWTPPSEPGPLLTKVAKSAAVNSGGAEHD